MFNKFVQLMGLILVAILATACNSKNGSSSASDVYSVNDVQKISLAQKDAGFDIKLPSALPEDYKFSSVVYSPDQQALTVAYIWANKDFNGETLTLTQQLAQPMVGYPAGSVVEDQLLGNVWAKIVSGGYQNGVWQQNASGFQMRWQAHDFYFTLIFTGSENKKADLTREQFIKLAEQILW